jgi:molybdopterin synthase sulfur carrier subunit
VNIVIEIKFFASLREDMGRGEAEINAADAATIGEVWARVADGKVLAENMLMARNMEYSSVDTPVADGDEVAFFPPVTGG